MRAHIIALVLAFVFAALAPARAIAARELYDYETDPHETANLAARPEHAATIAELSALLKSATRPHRNP